MTNDVQQFYGGGVDLLTLDKGFIPIQLKGPFNSALVNRTSDPNILQIELNFRNISEGDGKGFGVISPYRFDTGGDMGRTYVSSFTDLGIPGYAVPNYYEATGGTWSLSAAISSTNAFSTLVIGGGSTANHSLLKESGSTSSALTEITYSPGSTILSLTDGTGLGSTAEKLFVGRSGAGTHVLSDVTTGGPTVYGTMHANTAQTWGLVFSPLNASTPGTPTLIIFAGTSIYTLAASAAVGDAPTQVASGLNAGGYIIKGSTDGIVELTNLPPRIFFWKPEISSSTTGLPAGGTLSRGRIMHCNLEGTDIQELTTSLGNRVIWAVNFNGSIIASDGIRVIQVAGGEEDLGFAREYVSSVTSSPMTPAAVVTVVGFGIAEGTLYVLGATNANSAFLWRYNPTQRTFHNIGLMSVSNAGWTGQNLGPSGFGPASTLGPWPFSPQSRFMHFLPAVNSGTQKCAQYIVPPGWSPYWWQFNSAQPFVQAFQARVVSPVFDIEGVNAPMVLEEIIWHNEIFPIGLMSAASGAVMSGSNFVEINVATHSSSTGLGFTGGTGQGSGGSSLYGRFNRADVIGANRVTFPNNADAVHRVQYALSATLNGTSPYITFNMLPFTLRFLAFKDGVVKPPSQCGSASWNTY